MGQLKKDRMKTAGVMLALLLALTACGRKSEMTASTIADSELKTKTTQAEKEKREETETTGTADIQAQAENQVRPLALLAGQGNLLLWGEAESEALPRVFGPMVKLEEAERELYPELSQALDSVMEKRKKELQRIAENLLADSAVSLLGEDDSFVQNEIVENVSVRRADTRAVSLLFEGISYLGKEERSDGIHTVTIDTQTGKELACSDVVTDLPALTEAVYGEIRKHTEKTVQHLFKDSAQLEQLVIRILESDAWVLENYGLTLYFSTEEQEEEIKKMQSLTLSFAQYPELVKMEYQQVPESWGCEFFTDRHVYADVDGDGSLNDLVISGKKTEYGEYEALEILLDDILMTEPIYAFTIEPMLLYLENGKNVLYIETLGASDYRTISVYDLSSGAVKKRGEADGARVQLFDWESGSSLHPVLNNPESVSLLTRTFLLGTYDGIRLVRIDADGMPKAENECFHIVPDDGGEIIFTVRSPVQIDLVDEAGTVMGRTKLLPGAELSYYRTDNASFADLILPDGEIGRLYVTVNGAVLVNDMPLEAVLEGVRFAG